MIWNHMSWGNALVKAKTMSQIPLLHNFRWIFVIWNKKSNKNKKNSKTVASPTAVGALHTYTQTTRGLKQSVSWVMAPRRKTTNTTNYSAGGLGVTVIWLVTILSSLTLGWDQPVSELRGGDRQGVSKIRAMTIPPNYPSRRQKWDIEDRSRVWESGKLLNPHHSPVNMECIADDNEFPLNKNVTFLHPFDMEATAIPPCELPAWLQLIGVTRPLVRIVGFGAKTGETRKRGRTSRDPERERGLPSNGAGLWNNRGDTMNQIHVTFYKILSDKQHMLEQEIACPYFRGQNKIT